MSAHPCILINASTLNARNHGFARTGSHKKTLKERCRISPVKLDVCLVYAYKPEHVRSNSYTGMGSGAGVITHGGIGA